MKTLVLTVGSAGSGKTFNLVKVADSGDNNLPPIVFIAFDINTENAYDKWAPIQPNEIEHAFKNMKRGEKARVRLHPSDLSSAKSVATQLINLVRASDSGLILESCERYMDLKLASGLRDLMIENKHRGFSGSITCVFNSFTSIPNSLLECADFIVLHDNNLIDVRGGDRVSLPIVDLLTIATLLVDHLNDVRDSG